MSEINKKLPDPFSSMIENSVAPVLPPLSEHEVLRRKTPWDKFLEWVMRGGGGMALVFALISLSTIFWNGESFGILAVPVVIFLVSPLLGEIPVQRPWRMTAVMLFGGVLAAILSVPIDFAVYCYNNAANFQTAALPFFLENTLKALVMPEYSVGLCLLIIFCVRLSSSIATRYPWLDRSHSIRSWRFGVSGLGITLAVAGFLFTFWSGPYDEHRQWIREVKSDPRFAALKRGDEILAKRFDLDADLVDLGVPAEYEKQIEFFEQSEEATLVAVGEKLLNKLRSLESLDRSELWLMPHWMKRVRQMESASPELLGLAWSLWSESSESSWKLGLGEIVFLRSLSNDRLGLWLVTHPNLTPKLARAWWEEEKKYGYGLRTWEKEKELNQLSLAYELLENERLFEDGSTSYGNFLSKVETQQALLVDRGVLRPFETSAFQRRRTKYRTDEVYERARGRVRSYSHDSRAVTTSVLEARLHHFETGTFPEILQVRGISTFYRRIETGFEIFRQWGDSNENVLCRFPR